jgi:hypothetical protein
MTHQVPRLARAAQLIPTISVEQMREVDRLIIEEPHIELFQMMETLSGGLVAGRRLTT